MPGHERPPDVEIVATARADRLRFHTRPDVRVRHRGSGDRGSWQETARENIGSPVEPGRIYRRVYATTRIASRLIDRFAVG
jgi:hypothetical protein